MEYIARNLSNEIRKKYKLIEKLHTQDLRDNESKRKYLLSCEKNKKKAIETISQINSFKIENPCLQSPFSVPKNTKRRLIKEGIENIKDSFKWGKQNFDIYQFDESFIRNLAGRITPELYNEDIGKYREGIQGTTIKGASVTPPYPAKLIDLEIPRFVKVMKRRLISKDLIEKINTAIYSHLHIARMHPFVDGNGRTARIFQDIILDHNHIPLPIIEPGERNIYYEFLDKAIVDWKHKKSNSETTLGSTEGEHLFHTFIAGKINVSLDKILDCFSI
ncbi:fic/DOC family protein [archaeon BMS3Abin17]|nr:fic/DOC family protein [archaeon BMS3Abin17]